MEAEMVEMTFALDEVTVAKLRQSAARLDKSLREVVSEAIDDYSDRVWQLRERQNQHLLKVVNDIMPQLVSGNPGDDIDVPQRTPARRRARIARQA
jgi:hypothetical protein